MSVSPYLLIKRFRRSAIKFSTDSMAKCALISIYKSFDMAPDILYTILFIVNCNEYLSAEFIGQTFVKYNRIGKHFDLINSNNTVVFCGVPANFPKYAVKRLYCSAQQYCYTGWRRGVVISSGVGLMNEVNARRARLVLGWVTVFGRVYHLAM